MSKQKKVVKKKDKNDKYKIMRKKVKNNRIWKRKN